MNLTRRELFRTVGAGALMVGAKGAFDRAASLGAPGDPVDFAAVRADFPRAARQVWLAAAEAHPFSVQNIRIMEEYANQRALSPGGAQHPFDDEAQAETKQLFADLIGATPDEIAFAQSTTDGENVVVAGLDLGKRGGNVVIDDLHFTASRWLYEALERDTGVQVRVVRHRDWRIEPADMEKAIDRNTRLVSMALVSNINGFMHDVAKVSAIAHQNGAYVYADIIQGAGCTPIDVKAMGIDAAACTGYKWLMGDFGFAFLYVDKALQGSVIKPTRYGLRQVRETEEGFKERPGAVMYEGTTSFSFVGGLCAREGLRYIARLGVDNIRAHARRLTDRLQKEMPALGYPSITPADNPTPIVSFLMSDKAATDAKLQRAFGERVVTSRAWHTTDASGRPTVISYLRIGVSVYSNDADLDRFLDALAG